MSKENVFLYGVAGQVERFLQSSRGLIDWVGASKEYKNIMSTYLIRKHEPTFDEPTPPKGDKPTMAELERYKMQLRKQMDDQEEWIESKGRLFRTTINLCSRPLRNKLESDKKYQLLQDNHDINGLLDLIKELVYSTDESQEPVWIMADTMVRLHNTRQQDQESDMGYYKRLVSQIEVTESVWGPLIPSTMKGKATGLQEDARDAYLSRLFLRNLNKRHQADVNDLGKAFIDGNNNYPKDLESALTWITNRHANNGKKGHKKMMTNNTPTDNNKGKYTGSVSSFQQTTTADSTAAPPTTRFSGYQTRSNYQGRRPWVSSSTSDDDD